jgi:4-carboxymuconolactone decarboxylase
MASSKEEEYSYIPTSNNFEARYAGPPESELTPEQQAIRSSILASRPKTGLSGPFGPWLANPAIAQPSQQLGKVCRYDTSLSKRESELVILLTGAKYKSDTEFDIHAIEANRAGVAWDVIKSIPWRGEEEFNIDTVKKYMLPVLEREHDNIKSDANQPMPSREREVAIVLFTAELLDSLAVSDETYNTTKAVLGGKDSVLVEITAIIGYYAYVSYTLNVFRIPSGMEPVK